MDISKRLKNFLYFKQIKVSNFESQIGFSNGYVNSITRSIGNHKLAKIVERFPELNIEWLLVGKGSMLKSSAPDSAVVNEPETPYNYTVSKLDQAQEKIIALQEKLIEARDKFLDKDKKLFELQNDFIASQKKILELTNENNTLKASHEK